MRKQKQPRVETSRVRIMDSVKRHRQGSRAPARRHLQVELFVRKYNDF